MTQPADRPAPSPDAPTPGADCALFRPGETYAGKQGFDYAAGISAQSAGSKGVCMHLLTIPPGVRAKAHLHEGHETAIYMLSGVTEMLYGPDLERRMTVRRAICSTSLPGCRTCRSTPAPNRPWR